MSTTIFASVLYTSTSVLAILSFVIALLLVLVSLSLSSNLAVTTPLWLPTPFCSQSLSGCLPGDETCSPLPDCYIQVDVSTTSGPTALTIFAGVCGLLVGIAVLIAGTRLVRGEFWSEEAKHRYIRAFLSIALVYLIIAVAVLIYVFVVEYTQTHLTITDYYSKTLKGPFTREAWTCGLEQYSGQLDELHWTKAACTQAKVARWGLVPLTVCALVLVGCSISAWRREKEERGRDMRLNEVVA
ncbi:hypothetical protein BDV96DRAFT_567662 [Lophiotrema nucula]|uniref:Uncharacterized protein n=1 Tax=Lophiotrema nucula TaxID=690887 RepID=A0A6A5ZJN7_9PLEO|nr:hypothetical protein BDV96DRAFT_567662 [Lophiotrema nucula]